jgi:ATP-dependent DNA ligase
MLRRGLTPQALAARPELLREMISKLPDTIRFSETFDDSPSELMAAARSDGLEGVVAKRRDGSALPSLHCSVRTEMAR